MRPTIISLPQDIAIEKGSKASFTCSAVGIPTPTVEWFVGTQRVGKGSVFTITDVDSSKAGTYTCGVSNIAGSTTASATLVVFGKDKLGYYCHTVFCNSTVTHCYLDLFHHWLKHSFSVYPLKFLLHYLLLTFFSIISHLLFSLSSSSIYFVPFFIVLMFYSMFSSLPLEVCKSIFFFNICFEYLIDAFSVVQLVLTNIQNPNSEENCQYFDPTELETIINSATNMRVMVTRAAGSNLCDINSCSPSPCKNGARCSLKNVRKGYECTCTQGYMGINCNTDVDECSLQGMCYLIMSE